MCIPIFTTLSLLEIKDKLKSHTLPWKRLFTKVLLSEQTWKAEETQSHRSPLWSEEKTPHLVPTLSSQTAKWTHAIPEICKNPGSPKSK